jgi:hypothetical protein
MVNTPPSFWGACTIMWRPFAGMFRRHPLAGMFRNRWSYWPETYTHVPLGRCLSGNSWLGHQGAKTKNSFLTSAAAFWRHLVCIAIVTLTLKSVIQIFVFFIWYKISSSFQVHFLMQRVATRHRSISPAAWFASADYYVSRCDGSHSGRSDDAARRKWKTVTIRRFQIRCRRCDT